RLKQQYTCPKDNEVVGREDTVKGYEFAKDQYVVFTPEELKALEEKATGMIEIVEFVPLEKVDREYLEKVYYLGPDKGGDRAYRLLREALKYKDTVRERVLETIQRKVDGQDITADIAPDSGGKIIDLMEALKASLARAATDEPDAERLVS